MGLSAYFLSPLSKKASDRAALVGISASARAKPPHLITDIVYNLVRYLQKHKILKS